MGKGVVNGIQPKQNKTCSALLQNPWYLFRKCRSREVPRSNTTQETFLETTCIKCSS